MKLALVLGTNKSVKDLDDRIKGLKDNIITNYYSSIPELINESIKRNMTFDRIVIINKCITDKYLKDLYKYWSSTSQSTNIVILAQKGKDEDSVRRTLAKFTTPVVAGMLVQKTSLQILAEAILLPTNKITDLYGISDFLNVQEDEGYEYTSTEEPVKEVETPSVIIENSNGFTQPVNQPLEQPQPIPKKEKKSFFSSLFGSRKNNKVVNEPQQNVSDGQYNQYGTPEQENFQNCNNYENVQGTMSEQQIMNNGYPEGNAGQYNGNYVSEGYNDANIENSQSNFTEDNFENSQENIDSTSFHNDEYVDENFSENNSSVEVEQPLDEQFTNEDEQFEPEDEQFEPESEQVEPTYEQFEPTSEQFEPENEQIEPTYEESKSSEPAKADDVKDYEAQFEDYVAPVNAFQPEFKEVDEDFGDVDFSYSDQSNNEVQPAQEQFIVDDDFGEIGVASEEEAYRKNNEQPKVITQTVVKEVIRNVNTDKQYATLKGVYSGRIKKTIIVTGDRGSGVTSTALSLAKVFSEKVPVLYVDFDIDNHGLLNYINYEEFRNYENTHMNGIKLCKNLNTFNSCVMHFDNNFDILSSDFSCEATDKEIETVQGVISEVSTDYGVVVVDCPVSKLHLISDLVLMGNTVLCVEESKRGFMNMLCRMENSSLPLRYKRTIISRGNMFITKCNKKTDTKKLLKYINAIFEPSGADWLSMQKLEFNGKLSDEALNSVLEG